MGVITNVLIVGVGGQGTLLASRVIARAVVAMGHDVKVSEVHGMAQRGGSVVSQVRFGEQVFSPIIKKGDVDYLLGFEKLEAARYMSYLKPQGTLIINDERIDPLPVMSGEMRYPDKIGEEMVQKVKHSLLVPASRIAADCGNVRAANMVLVGVLAKAAELPWELVTDAVKAEVPERVLEVNLKAVEAGRRLYVEACSAKAGEGEAR